MGNCCCFGPELPCGSMEERSGLLKDDSKTSGAGACGPENDEDTSVEETKEKPPNCQNSHRESGATQGNGHLQNKNLQEANTSPSKDSTAGAQREEQKDSTADQRTLNQTQKNISAPDAQEVLAVAAKEPKTEKQSLTAGQENVSDLVSPKPESALPENLSPPETNTPTEDNTASGSHAGSGGDAAIRAEAKPSEDFTQNNEALSEPSAQEPSISVVSQETNTDAPRCSVECNVDSVDPKSHVIPQPPASGSEPAGVGPTQENLDSVGSNTTPEAASAAEAKDSLKSNQEENRDPEGLRPAEEKEEKTGENVPEEEKKDEEKKQDKVEDGLTQTEDPQDEKQPAIQEQLGTSDVQADVVPNAEEEDGLDDSEEDLYRGEEELSAMSHKPRQTSDSESLKVQDSCSLSPAVDILSYSEREWKGNTAKSALIRKGYKEMSAKFSHLRRVRGDNYCALRATLFQVLSQSVQVPQWLQDDTVLMLPKQLKAQEGLISQWRFPGQHAPGDGAGDPTERLKGYMELLRKTWQAAAERPGSAERQQLCERLFQGEEEELGMLEALKLLMLGRAAELHGHMQAGQDVPLFCWLLFARDSSDCPRSFLSNHLRHVGLSAGLEQVEMFLLGYALQHTIQVYRLYKANTEEFVTFYPDDHLDDWPSVCLVTEDDRHYNVPVAEAAEPGEELTAS
ncbi:ubiquitin thioesterase otulin [Xiphophorus maculatus]|uniref:OTU deubiquitinase with linear linkage specificity n=1 Tax=Xiphophorus maculatus TaxID=8083 RepID=M3ZIJ2_XIPMA|nr:ubiquitin thioesterase otulin [Xiphophorus maculatus]